MGVLCSALAEDRPWSEPPLTLSEEGSVGQALEMRSLPAVLRGDAVHVAMISGLAGTGPLLPAEMPFAGTSGHDVPVNKQKPL